MKTLKIVRLVLAVSGVLMAGGWACAQGSGGPGMGPGFGQHRPPMERSFGFANGQFWNNPNVVKQLSLGDDQRKAMDGILQDHRMRLIDLQATLRKAELAVVDGILDTAAEAVKVILTEGPAAAMNRFNRKEEQ